MKIGLIDVDGHRYPNLPLMKISAYHKSKGDEVSWHEFGEQYDRVYMSKVFSFTEDYSYYIWADEIIKGGSGYCISTVNGKEEFDSAKDHCLPYVIEHTFPDYTIYPELTKNTAYGFLSRGCPRQCNFCHVAAKEGCKSIRVADIHEFWNGQKRIVLQDPNILACDDWKDILDSVIKTGAVVDFNQGLDLRLLDEDKLNMVSQLKLKQVHFAWDRISDEKRILPNLETFVKQTNIDGRNISVFCLVNFDSTFEEDLYRVEKLRELGVTPYIMIYDKKSLPRGHILKRLERWCNNKIMWHTFDTLEDAIRSGK